MDHSESDSTMSASPLTIQDRNRKMRRRRRPATAATGILPFALVALAAAAAEGGEELHLRQQKQQQQQQQNEDAINIGADDIRSTSLQRHLQGHTHETLARWRALRDREGTLDYTTLRPLDLVLDESDPTHERAYQRGANGFLEPYDFENYQSQRPVENLADYQHQETMTATGGDDDVHHRTSDRMGLTNFDLNRGIGAGGKEDAVYEEEGRELGTARGARGDNGGTTRNLSRGDDRHRRQQRRQPSDAFFFKYTEENDPVELEGYDAVVVAEEEPHDDERRQRRVLQSHHAKSSSAARGGFASSGIVDDVTAVISANGARGKSPPADRTGPIIRATFPPLNTAVGARQTFGALVSGEVRNVCLQFKDHKNHRSDCFGLENVAAKQQQSNNSDDHRDKHNKKKDRGGRAVNNNSNSKKRTSDIWELSFEGFATFAGRRWQYRVRSTDVSRNRRSTSWRTFSIDESLAKEEDVDSGGGSGGRTDTAATEAAAVATEATAKEEKVRNVEKLTEEVSDTNWPHGGIVQGSTGRILFFFDDHPYVCSGTVLQDPHADRTIILTAGHCAYQYRDVGGRFAQHALYIPNQVDTRGDKSNEVCADDPLGCWIPAFAIVDYEWTVNSFPHSVPWDYAFYVIPNDPAVHEGGFIHKNQPKLSKILEEIIEPMPIDFNWRLEDSSLSSHPGEFTHGLGYSFDKDPAFRYCATNVSTKFGIDTYENLWLGSCEMTGGSSGGPWLRDTDTDGRGTIISVNSWGYSTTPGMAGPDFNTRDGGKVECLFEVAMSASFEDMVGQRGIVVDYC